MRCLVIWRFWENHRKSISISPVPEPPLGLRTLRILSGVSMCVAWLAKSWTGWARLGNPKQLAGPEKLMDQKWIFHKPWEAWCETRGVSSFFSVFKVGKKEGWMIMMDRLQKTSTLLQISIGRDVYLEDVMSRKNQTLQDVLGEKKGSGLKSSSFEIYWNMKWWLMTL